MLITVLILTWTIAYSLSIINNTSSDIAQRCFMMVFIGFGIYLMTSYDQLLSKTQIPHIPNFMELIVEAVLTLFSIYLTFSPYDHLGVVFLSLANICLILTNVTLHESFENVFILLLSLEPILSTSILVMKRIIGKYYLIFIVFGYLIANTMNYFYREWFFENYNQFNRDLFIWSTKLIVLIFLTVLHLHASYFLLEEYENRLEIPISQFKQKGATSIYYCKKFALISLVIVCLTLFWTFDKLLIDDGKWTEVLEILIILNYCLPVVILLRFPQSDPLWGIHHESCDAFNLASAAFSFYAIRSFTLIYSH